MKHFVRLTALAAIALLAASCADNAPLYRVFEKGKFGYADASGKTVITPAYDQCGEFS